MGAFRRIFKPVKHIDWSYAVGEIILIFVGISLAIWFNNWNEDRNERHTEVRLLREIEANLSETIEHFQNVNREELRRSRSYLALADHIHAERSYNDSLQRHLYLLSSYTDYFPRTAGFESLSNWGIYRLTTDSIRSQLTSLYEKEYVSVKDMVKVSRDIYTEIFLDEILEHIDYSQGFDLRLRDNDRFVADKDFANKLYSMSTDKIFGVEFVQEKVDDMIRIRDNLRWEIERLD